MSKKKKKEYVNVLSPVGIISYPYLVEADTGREYSDNKFKLDILIPKATWEREGKEIEAAILKLAREHFADSPEEAEALTLDDFKGPIVDMDTVKKASEHEKGCIRIRAKSSERPTIIGPKKGADGKFAPLSAEEVKNIKGGDIGRLWATAFYYPQQGGGISLGLNAVQFSHKGKPLGGGIMKAIQQLGELEVVMDDPEGMTDTKEMTPGQAADAAFG